MEYELVQKLASELNVTRMALGQVICNHERYYRNLSLQQIAKNWLSKTRHLSKKEWLAGSEALIHYCQTSPSASSREAIEILSPPELRYEENIYWGRGRNKNDKIFSLGYEILKAEFGIHPVDEIGDNRVIKDHPTPQIAQCDKGDSADDSGKTSMWKTKLAKVISWLKNPEKVSVTL